MIRLKELRKEKGYTQQELADKLGVTQATFSGWETGKYEIDNQSLLKLATILDASTDYILGHTDIRKPISDKKSPPPATEAADEETELKVWGHKRGSASWEHINSKDFEEDTPSDPINKQILDLLQKLPQEEKLKLLGRLEAMVDFLK